MAALTSAGHKVTTQKIQKDNACELYVDSELVWSCNITEFKQGANASHPMCVAAVNAVDASGGSK
ncbi:hypothetical protein KP79_PYT06054 [Mizuhopecten yessoensis]|uniref:Uncharacterized protein n=1 Tax=Mizuhopecten yessoensis TaxID=6573 RepID=A0A210PLY4_MIZYE|nr:hypothetical protein KP79_PYT06054 [Mizuhopecten yessoensis]